MTMLEVWVMILATIIVGSLIRLTNIWSTHLKKDDRSKEVRQLLCIEYAKGKKETISFLNEFVTDCMQDYIMNNILPDIGLTYINKDRENKIRADLTNKVKIRLSDTIYRKMSLYFSEEHIGEMLAEKIYITVTIYVADFNMDRESVRDSRSRVKEQLKKEIPIDEDW